MTNGTPVVTWACNGHPDQTWGFNGDAANSVPGQIRNSQNPGKSLGVLGSATSDGASLAIWDCNHSADQSWLLTPSAVGNSSAPFGCYKIQNQNAAPKVMGALGGNATDGTQVVIWDSLAGTAHDDQVWCPD